MATEKTVTLRPTRLMRLAREYATRFGTKVPSSQSRAVSMGELPSSELEARIERALLAGHPDKEWEEELARVRAMRDDGRQLPVEAYLDLPAETPAARVDLDNLRTQFHGRKFGELVLEHHEKLDLPTTAQALTGITQELPARAQPLVESWVDNMNPSARVEQFWQQDCGVALMSITTAAATKLRGVGIEPSSDDLFNMFQIIVLNFAYAAHMHPQSKAFIQKAIGIGFFRRLFG